VLPFQQRFDLEAERQLDRFARSASRCDDDDPTGGGLGGEVSLGIGGEEVVAGDAHDAI